MNLWWGRGAGHWTQGLTHAKCVLCCWAKPSILSYFRMWCSVRIQLYLLACGCPVFPTPFVEKNVPSPLSRISWLYARVGPLFSIDQYVVFMSVPHCFDDDSFFWLPSLKLGSVRPPTLSFFKVFLIIWVPLQFQTNFRIDVYISAKKKNHWDLDMYCIESVAYWVLTS